MYDFQAGVNFGSDYGSGVGYALYYPDNTVYSPRTATGIVQRVASTGLYDSAIGVADDAFVGELRWDTGGASPKYASQPINPDPMAPIQFKIVTFDPDYAGRTTVGYTVYNRDGSVRIARTTIGVTERGTRTGIFGALIDFGAAFTGVLVWDTGGADAVYSSESLNLVAPAAASTGTPSLLDNTGLFNALAYNSGLLGVPESPPAGSVVEAIHDYFTTRADLQGLIPSSELYHLEAPEDTELPYIEFFKVSEPSDVITTGCLVNRATVQFNCYHWSSSEAIAIRTAVELAYSRAPMRIGAGLISHCIPQDPMESKAEGKGPGGKDCYAAMITFDILYTKSY